MNVRVKVRQTFTPVWCLQRSEGMIVKVKIGYWLLAAGFDFYSFKKSLELPANRQ
jgi:hypothetical protein